MVISCELNISDARCSCGMQIKLSMHFLILWGFWIQLCTTSVLGNISYLNSVIVMAEASLGGSLGLSLLGEFYPFLSNI